MCTAGASSIADRRGFGAHESKIAENDLDNMGDISTLADPSVVNNLISGSSQV